MRGPSAALRKRIDRLDGTDKRDKALRKEVERRAEHREAERKRAPYQIALLYRGAMRRGAQGVDHRSIHGAELAAHRIIVR